MTPDLGISGGDSPINPAILFDEDGISGKIRISSEEAWNLAVNSTLAAYEKSGYVDVMGLDPDGTEVVIGQKLDERERVDVLDQLTNDFMSLLRSRNSKEGTNSDLYLEAVKVRIMSIRNLPKDNEDEF